MSVTPGETSGKRTVTDLVDQVLTSAAETDTPAAILRALVPDLLQVLEPLVQGGKAGGRAVLQAFGESLGLDGQGLDWVARNLQAEGLVRGRTDHGERRRAGGRTRGFRSTLIAENGNVSALGLPAKKETIPGRFSVVRTDGRESLGREIRNHDSESSDAPSGNRPRTVRKRAVKSA